MYIQLVPKKSSGADPSNYRSIVVTSILCKMYRERKMSVSDLGNKNRVNFKAAKTLVNLFSAKQSAFYHSRTFRGVSVPIGHHLAWTCQEILALVATLSQRGLLCKVPPRYFTRESF